MTVEIVNCNACGLCAPLCPNGAIGAAKTYFIRPEKCDGCWGKPLCVAKCPLGGIVMDEDLIEVGLSSNFAYEGKMLRVRVDRVRLPDGREATREVIEHAGSVAVVPILASGQVVLVRQYRRAVGEVLWEIPAGKRDEAEEPLSCAGRELAEETGYRAGAFKLLTSFYPAPGSSQERMWLYLAQDLEAGPVAPDEDEFLQAEALDGERVSRMLEMGQIRDGKTILGLTLTRELWSK